MIYDKLGYPKDEAARKRYGRSGAPEIPGTLERYADLIDQQETDKKKAGYVMKSKEDIEKEARAKAAKTMDRFYARRKI